MIQAAARQYIDQYSDGKIINIASLLSYSRGHTDTLLYGIQRENPNPHHTYG